MHPDAIDRLYRGLYSHSIEFNRLVTRETTSAAEVGPGVVQGRASHSCPDCLPKVCSCTRTHSPHPPPCPDPGPLSQLNLTVCSYINRVNIHTHPIFLHTSSLSELNLSPLVLEAAPKLTHSIRQ